MNKTATLVVSLLAGLLLSGCSSHNLVGPNWSSKYGEGTSNSMAFTSNGGFVRRYAIAGPPPEPFVGRYSVEDGTLLLEGGETASGISPSGKAPFSWDGDKLILNEGQPQTFSPSKDGDDSTLELRGMWKREGEVPEGEPFGLIFMPLRVEVMLGGTGRFEEEDGFEKDWQVCDYTCPDAVTLAETLDGRYVGNDSRIYMRERSYRIEENRLTLKTNGEPDQVYRKVDGDFPFGGKGFDKAAWDKLL